MKSNRSNILVIIIIFFLIIPQTRKLIQVLLHKGIALVNPVKTIDVSEREKVKNFDWQLRNEKDESVNFEVYKGKVILINFWATWCPPCIAEMPSLQQLYNKYGDEIEFLFVTNDALDEKITNFKQKKNYTFPVYQIISQPPNELITSSIPRTVIINVNGEIVIDKSGAVDWFSEDIQLQIEALLEQ